MKFPVWATVTLGTGLSDPLKIRRVLKKARWKVGEEAALMLEAGSALSEKTEVDLVVVSGIDLGCGPRTPLGELRAAGLSQGLLLSHSEVPWQACLQCREYVSKDVRLLFATEPVLVTNALGPHPDLFVVYERYGDFWLGTDSGMEAALYGAETKLVFVQPRS